MFAKFRRNLGLCAISSLALAITASSASATTAVITGGGANSATGTTGVQLTLNTARRTINCSSDRQTLTLLASGTYNNITLPFTLSTDLVSTFSTCTLTGGLRPTDTCGNSTLAATGLTASGVTPVQITGNNCTISLSASCSVRITGSVTGSYDNSTGDLTVNSPGGQSLAATGSTCATLPNDSSATFGAAGGGNHRRRFTIIWHITISFP